MLSHLGFWCMVLDDREEYTDHSLFPGVQETKNVDFTALLQILEVKPGRLSGGSHERASL